MLLVKKIFTHRWKCWHGWVDPTWHRGMVKMYPTCIFVRYDSKYDRKLSTKWPNQGLLIDKTVDSGLSIFCQIRHPSPCSVSTDHLSIPPMRCPFDGFNDVLGVFLKASIEPFFTHNTIGCLNKVGVLNKTCLDGIIVAYRVWHTSHSCTKVFEIFFKII